jgi:hypothetical protein
MEVVELRNKENEVEPLKLVMSEELLARRILSPAHVDVKLFFLPINWIELQGYYQLKYSLSKCNHRSECVIWRKLLISRRFPKQRQ